MSEKYRSTRRFSADRYRRMAARFSQLPEEEDQTALVLCHWENNCGKTDDGDPEERRRGPVQAHAVHGGAG